MITPFQVENDSVPELRQNNLLLTYQNKESCFYNTSGGLMKTNRNIPRRKRSLQSFSTTRNVVMAASLFIISGYHKGTSIPYETISFITTIDAFVPAIRLNSHTTTTAGLTKSMIGQQQHPRYNTILFSDRSRRKSNELHNDDSYSRTSTSRVSSRIKIANQGSIQQNPTMPRLQSALISVDEESVSRKRKPTQKKVISIRNNNINSSLKKTSSDTGVNSSSRSRKVLASSSSSSSSSSRKRRETSTTADYASETLMLQHDLLTMDDEQELGLAVHKAAMIQQKIDAIIATKQMQQAALQQSIQETLSNERRQQRQLDDEIRKARNAYDGEDSDDDNDEEEDDDDDNVEDGLYGQLSPLSIGTGPSTLETFYVGNPVSPITKSEQNHIDGISVLRNMHSKSRISHARLLQADDDDDVHDVSSSLVNDDDNIVRSFDSVFVPIDSSNFFDAGLSDDEIRNSLELEGGRQELRQILIDGAIARDKLISSNMKLVSSIAKKWSKLSAMAKDMSPSDNSPFTTYTGGWDRPSLSEAIQEGTIGLVRAVERFNPRRGLRFSTYATYWITNTIRQCFQKTSTGTIRVPSNYHDTKRKYKTLLKQYYDEMGGNVSTDKGNNNNSEQEQPSIAVIAKQMHMSPKRLRTILELTRPLLSIDAPIMRGVTTKAGKSGGHNPNSVDAILLSDTLIYGVDGDIPHDGVNGADPTFAIELSFLRQCLENAMATELSPHERDVIRLRLGLDDGYSRSCKEVSQCVGGSLSTSEVRSTELRAFKKLRSPQTLSTYKLLSYLDFADLDMASIKLK